jgi:hypothetical protein
MLILPKLKKSQLYVAWIVILLLLVLGLGLSSNDNAYAINIAQIKPTSGSVGTTLEIVATLDGNGHRFEIYWDAVSDKPITSGKASDFSKLCSAIFTVPPSYGGKHFVIILDIESGATSVTDFDVKPTIELSSNTGIAGSYLTIIGSGFGASEASISVTWDGVDVKSGIQADKYGSWANNFHVPAGIKGVHKVEASGFVTSSKEIVGREFIIKPSFSLGSCQSFVDTCGSFVGNSISGFGNGFSTNESNIKLFLDGKQLNVDSISADVFGSWTTTFDVPGVPGGIHRISAVGVDTGVEEIHALPELEVLPLLKLVSSPENVPVPSRVELEGTGFASAVIVYIMQDDEMLKDHSRTNKYGVFHFSFMLPQGNNGLHKIRALDEVGNEDDVALFVEDECPCKPELILPEDGCSVILTDTSNMLTTLIQNAPHWKNWTMPLIVSKTSPLAFSWQQLEKDKSDVSFVLQVASDQNFTNPLIIKSDLVLTRYELEETELLSKTTILYWRVQTVDKPGNKSDWSETRSLRIGLPWLVWIIAAILLLFITIGAVLHKYVPGLMGLIYRKMTTQHPTLPSTARKKTRKAVKTDRGSDI